MFETPKRSYKYLPIQQRSYLQMAPQRHKLSSSPSKSSLQPKKQSRSSSNKKTTSKQIKSYHFSNCIYQGQMKAYHRVGRGIILHDNGLSGIIRSGSNRLKDHNIFLGENVLISAIYKQHQLDVVVKDQRNILVMKIDKKDNKFAITSPGYFIEFDYHRVSEVKFRNNVLVEKLVLTQEETDEIIQSEEFHKIMRQEHIQALKFNFFDKFFPQIQVIPKGRNQYHIGFTQKDPNTKFYQTTYKLSYQQNIHQTTQLQGVGFIVEKIPHDAIKKFQYDLHIIQRGFYSNGKLDYFGQIFYENGSYYFGGLKNQQMHGNGIIVNPQQKKFAFGIFKDGKPVKLDENRNYRLDTEEGQQVYMNLRKKLHSSDPEVWIDSEVNDLPNLEYFRQKIKQCTQFLFEDKQMKNYIKSQQSLRLSRKVDDFLTSSRYSLRSQGRYLDGLSSRSRDISGPIHQSRQQYENQDIKRKLVFNNEAEQQLDKHFNPIYTFSPQRNELLMSQTSRNQQSSQFDNKRSINQSIVDRFKSDENINSSNRYQKNVQISNQQTNTFDSYNNQQSNKQSPKFTRSGELDDYNISTQRKQQTPKKLELSLKPYDIQVKGPLQNSHPSSVKSSSRSYSRSQSRSLSKSLSKRSIASSQGRPQIQQSNSRKYVGVNEPQRPIHQEDNPQQRKTSIIDELVFNDVNTRFQQLSKEYENLDSFRTRVERSRRSREHVTPEIKQSPYKVPIQTSYNARLRTASEYGKVSNRISQQSKEDYAANQALRLANSNKVKQQKYLHYQHYTHKRHYDYTSQQASQGAKPFDNIKVLSKQTHFQRTPEKVSCYDQISKNLTINRTIRKQQADRVVNRLYPHQYQNTEIKRPQKMYDSSYQRSLQLNSQGKTLNNDRLSRKIDSEYTGGYKYGQDFKAQVIRNNAVGRQ